jgi:hypothetical protein
LFGIKNGMHVLHDYDYQLPTERAPLIAIAAILRPRPLVPPLQNATSPPALLEPFGPAEVASAALNLSA